MNPNENQPVQNTDRELWREREGDYYSDSIHVTETGGIGIKVGGLVIVQPLRVWMELAKKAILSEDPNAFLPHPLSENPSPSSAVADDKKALEEKEAVSDSVISPPQTALVLEALKEARTAFNEILTLHWGWDGDCGAHRLANDGFDVVDNALKAILSSQGGNSPATSVSSPELERKISVLDATVYILNGLRAVTGVLEKQRQAKENAKRGFWNQGYVAAMQDAIKSIESFIQEIDGTAIPASPVSSVERDAEQDSGEKEA